MDVLARISKVSESTGTDRAGAPKPLDSYAQERAAPKSSRAYGLSIISAALTVTGRLESTGDIQIEGKVEGDVRGQAVRIADTGMVTGTVMGEIVELAGTVEGKIDAESVTLTKTARMSGDIVHETLRIETGAHFEGSSRPQHKKNVTKAADPIHLVSPEPDPVSAPTGKAVFSQI